MTIFKSAERQNISLLIGLAGGTGSGKTMSAMRIATGMVGRGKKFAVIDTENGRSLHYAPRHGEPPDYRQTFCFDHLDLRAPFRPEAYVEAIEAADKAGYEAIVVDSMSHVWAGEGGVLDWQEEELDRMAGTDWKKREACNLASWKRPKMSHKQMVSRLLQVKAHRILSFRAEEKIKMIKVHKENVYGPQNYDPITGEELEQEATGQIIVPEGFKESDVGKTVVSSDGWQPIAEKYFPYELTLSLLFNASSPGIPKFMKPQEQLNGMIPMQSKINESVGAAMAAWARGEGQSHTQPMQEAQNEPPAEFITVDQQVALDDALNDAKIRLKNMNVKNEFLAAIKLPSLSMIPAGDYKRCLSSIQNKGAKS